MTTLDPTRLFGTIADRFYRVLIGYSSLSPFPSTSPLGLWTIFLNGHAGLLTARWGKLEAAKRSRGPPPTHCIRRRPARPHREHRGPARQPRPASGGPRQRH